MSDNKEKPHCKKCGCPYSWDKLKNPPSGSKRANEGKLGWWMEMLTKEDHTEERCNKFKEGGNFSENLQKSSADSQSSSPRANIDLTEKEQLIIEGELQPQIRELIVVETAIRNEFAKFGIEIQPAHVGLYLKLLQDRKLHAS